MADPTPLPTTWRSAARDGDETAADRLLPELYGELRRLAAGYLAREGREHTLQPTALINEAYLRLADQRELGEDDREHFLALAARTMRRILVDHARKRQALKREGAAGERLTLAGRFDSSASEPVDLLGLDDCLERLAKLDARAARVVELRFFGGLTVRETAEVLEVSERTVDSDWFFARGWLSKELSSGPGAGEAPA